MKTTLLLALITASLLAGGCNADDAPGSDSVSENSAPETAADNTPTDSSVIAVVNGVEISEERIAFYSQRPISGEEERKLVIDNMVSSEIIAQVAQSEGFADRPEVREQLAIARQAVLGRAYVTEFLDNNPITEKAQQKRYEELIEEYADTKEYNASHILVAEEDQANELLAKIKASPDSFADLAKEHSEDTGSAEQGGSLGWVLSQSLVPEFGAALKQLDKGGITKAPVKTNFGWHIIRLDDVRPIPAPELNDSLREQLVQSMRAEQITEHVSQLREKAEIEIR